MPFNKEIYWDNRRRGVRGQGEKFEPVIDMNTDDYKKHNGEGQHFVQVGTRLVQTNRQVARRLERKSKSERSAR